MSLKLLTFETPVEYYEDETQKISQSMFFFYILQNTTSNIDKLW